MRYQDQNDETLVMLTLAGEPSAYEVLVARYEGRVLSAALSVTRQRFMAEDAAQDAFVAAWMKLDTLREPEKYGVWVCRIAKNCAKNMVVRFRSFLPLEAADGLPAWNDIDGDPAAYYASSEEKKELRKSISGLPVKVRQVIYLHYFENLSIVEIADRMRVSAGTVKWQLHDGRKRIRRELCAMNEKWNDTLVQRVMKKVEELKQWQVKNSKDGFSSVYAGVLREVEELPESKEKYHALADMLMCGWWWLPGEKNDAVFARMKEAAELGHNDEVMEVIVGKEDEKLYGQHKIEWIRDKQIPWLEQAGFVRTLAREWFWLGYAYFENGQQDEGFAAYKKVLSLLEPSDINYAQALAAIRMEERIYGEYRDLDSRKYQLRAYGEEYRWIDGAIRHWRQHWYSRGRQRSANMDADEVFRNASYCDGFFMVDGMSLGETHIGSDGTTLTFAGDAETVTAPCGEFDNCRLWVTCYRCVVYRTWYKEGVGIVRQEQLCGGNTEVRLLKRFHIVGGKGPLPCATGNTWVYTAGYDETVMHQEARFVMCYADEQTVFLSMYGEAMRFRYDETSWLDMIQQIRSEYCQETDTGSRICDVSYPIRRAEELAATPLQKAYTKAACSVARRIMETNPTFCQGYTATGHWNFFEYSLISNRDGRLLLDREYRFSFEWKDCDSLGIAGEPLLHNDILGILQDATGCIWSEEWKAGASPLVEYILWGNRPIRTQVRCETAESITTKAGTFKNCLKVSLSVSGMTDGWCYRGGEKEYYFADGVGIVRTVSLLCGGTKKAVYELTSYEGTGEGFMPFTDGMVRRYDAIGMTDGFVGSVEYSCVIDSYGHPVLFTDRTGIRKRLEAITQYRLIEGEQWEERLENEGRHEESCLRHDVNTFHLLEHFLGRPTRYWGFPKKAVAWNKCRLQLLEHFSPDGEIPPAWMGFAAITAFRTGCALFGVGEKEEGYRFLETAFSLAEKWLRYPNGELLAVGDPLIFGGVRLVKGEELIELPDGTREPVSYDWLFTFHIEEMYYGMTALHGWEWFDSVRQEERFRACIERVKLWMEKQE